jgi:hypothetical protein
MKTTITIDSNWAIPKPIIAMAVRPERKRSFQGLLGFKDATERIYFRARGPEGSVFEGPTLSNGHWILTRPTPATKAAKTWDKLLEKAKKIAGVKNGEDFAYDRTLGLGQPVPEFEKMLDTHREDRKAAHDELRFLLTDRYCKHTACTVSMIQANGADDPWACITSTKPVKFNLRIMGPLLGHFVVKVGSNPCDLAQLEEPTVQRKIVGFVAPVRL